MLHEVITRRLKRALADGAMPDLLVIDGGKGQLSAALAAARDLGVATRPDPGNPGLPFVQMVGLAKSRTLDAAALSTTRVISRRSARSVGLAEAAERAGKGFVAEAARTPERVFLPNRKDPVVLRQNSAELYLLVRLRDEAHRFAIEFHRKLRRARTLRSGLDEIPGIGESETQGAAPPLRFAAPGPGGDGRGDRPGRGGRRGPGAPRVRVLPPPRRRRVARRGRGTYESCFPEGTMTTPDDFSIQPVVDALCREAEPVLAGHYRMVLPSRERVIGIVEDVRALFFPGYFGTQDLRGDTPALPRRAPRWPGCASRSTRRSAGPWPSPRSTTSTPASTARWRPPRPPGSSSSAFRPCALVAGDVEAAYEGDPALATRDEAIFAYPGIFAVTNQRIAHELHVLGVPLIPRIITEHAHTQTGIDIHPGRAHRRAASSSTTAPAWSSARPASSATACALYQGVTLGAKSFPLDESGKPIKGIDRHPIVEDDVVIYAGATILGRIVIGRGSSIGGNVLADPRGAAGQQGHAGSAGRARLALPSRRRNEWPSIRGTTWSSPGTWRRPSRPSSRSPPARR